MTGDPRQGDYLPGVDRLVVAGPKGRPIERETPQGVVLVSQCCDMARSGSGDPVASAVVRLSGSAASEARSGRQPRYAALPWLGEDVFADFATTGGLEHAFVFASDRTPAPSTDDRIRFAGRVTRRFGRFAYPDSVQPFLRRIQMKIRSKASSESSPLGRCLQRVVTVRVENEEGWDAPLPWNLGIVFVLQEGELPTPGPSSDIRSAASTIAGLAEQIVHLQSGSAGLDQLWQALVEQIVADSWADADVQVVGDVVVEVLEEGEFSYLRYRRSADIDVDDLSD